ncbi:kinase-like domain-containing protein [Neohortaea acidophila]|uniref:non-specific serine/threonine protein kinase n=1 Tax=Neohortaea acidophila TaxID=245834 RepID=A0A6A6PZL1_9PEZI|nr:kinase-like domain-containing protein [Neohortaea acidophila]KAF2485465.1 kinase-like domain-containing protein [Neohortaea acidophila]
MDSARSFFPPGYNAHASDSSRRNAHRQPGGSISTKSSAIRSANTPTSSGVHRSSNTSATSVSSHSTSYPPVAFHSYVPNPAFQAPNAYRGPPNTPENSSATASSSYVSQIGSQGFVYPRDGPGRNALTHHSRPPRAVRLGSKTYTIGSVIQPPSGGNTLMSDGVRIIIDSHSRDFVEKRLKMHSAEQRERANAEMNALQQIRRAGGSPHVNQIEDAFWQLGTDHASLVLDFCNANTLEAYIDSCRRKNEKIDEQFCWQAMAQLSAGIAMCHYGVPDPFSTSDSPADWNAICHLDIKPANVFMDTRKSVGYENLPYPTLILGDFGCCITKDDRMRGKIKSNVPPYGTAGWFPPETTYADPGPKGAYGKHSDIWQLGGVIQTMCRLIAVPDTYYLDTDRPCGRGYTPQLGNAVRMCMHKEAFTRPNAIDVAKNVKRLSGLPNRPT